MLRAWVALIGVASCSSPSAPVAQPLRPPAVRDAATIPADAPPDAAIPDAAIPDAEIAPADVTTKCAVVELGLDLRALPTHSRAGSIDMYVASQADDVRAAASPGSELRTGVMPGTGVLELYFDGDVAHELARCKRTIARYLKTAPRLPVTHTPAVEVTLPCRPCGPHP